MHWPQECELPSHEKVWCYWSLPKKEDENGARPDLVLHSSLLYHVKSRLHFTFPAEEKLKMVVTAINCTYPHQVLADLAEEWRAKRKSFSLFISVRFVN